VLFRSIGAHKHTPRTLLLVLISSSPLRYVLPEAALFSSSVNMTFSKQSDKEISEMIVKAKCMHTYEALEVCLIIKQDPAI
jgi:hypothetical protein